LQAILSAIRVAFAIAPKAEISIEAHPDTVTHAMLDELREPGFNRISFGAESMDARELIRVGRAGSPTGIVRVMQWAKSAGFSNINLDLMYGLPGQNLLTWRASLHGAIALEPAHLSCYALTVEENTKLEHAIHRGDIPGPDAELQNEMEDVAEQELTAAGFRRYEISNYHRDNSQCRHNLLYWSGAPYLGLGPSAQSFLGNVRYGNVSNLADYVACLEAGQLPRTDMEYLSPSQRKREAAVFGLRKIAGIPAGLLFADRSPDRAVVIQRLLDENYLERSGSFIRLTSHGRRYADEVAVQLV
jgi:oxygen-independent coproporphyrinogen-3 oxidase